MRTAPLSSSCIIRQCKVDPVGTEQLCSGSLAAAVRLMHAHLGRVTESFKKQQICSWHAAHALSQGNYQLPRQSCAAVPLHQWWRMFRHPCCCAGRVQERGLRVHTRLQGRLLRDSTSLLGHPGHKRQLLPQWHCQRQWDLLQRGESWGLDWQHVRADCVVHECAKLPPAQRACDVAD